MLYGMGLDIPKEWPIENGFVTTVEFHGEVVSVPEKGLRTMDKYLDKYRAHDAIRFDDGVVAVLKPDKLQNESKVAATSLRPTD